ncbi:MAG: hypothetical protein MI810_22280 [Flavobacteriales bacterium]|nr:hypothetical protein [Flavobacteriales bacterium]
MKLKKMLLAILVTFILSNVLTTVWYMVMDDANYVPYRRAEMNYGLLVLNHLIFAAIFVCLHPFFFQKSPKVERGMVYGLLMAAMMFIPQALVVRAIWEVDVNTIFFLNTLAHLAIGAILGVAVSLIYNYKNN